ncbi:MAG: xylosidase [Ruminococcaceae bacterium]|nr:xylosidase [Oscillospiraceae bacterium]
MKHPVNPLLPLEYFIPDVEAHVWNDGRIYLYGSKDIAGEKTYCSREYHVFSSDNMTKWVDHGVAFSLDDVSWAKDASALYAPDCAYKDGTYYLYYCIPDGRCGVATSNCPYGPFKDVGPIEHVTMIDPAVFIDDDGQAYIYWGQFDGVRVAKLKDNMTEIYPETITQPLSVAEHEFHEGSSIKKINGKYYYLFTDTHRHGNKATCLGYAVSDNPMAGFEYRGVVIDNYGCDPGTWNNHGSIEKFNGQWYVFYHRSTHGWEFSRHVCAESITFTEEGNIEEVEMTTSGVAGAIPAGEHLACSACKMTGNVRFVKEENRYLLAEIKPGDTALYRYIKFNGEENFSVKCKCFGRLNIELYIDEKCYGVLLADTQGEYKEITAEIPAVSGVKSIELKFTGNFSEGEIESFSFF